MHGSEMNYESGQHEGSPKCEDGIKASKNQISNWRMSRHESSAK